MKENIIVRSFIIKEQEIVLVHLNSFDWEFEKYGNVYIVVNNRKIKMDYIGFGNHNNIPTLSLKLNDLNYSNLHELEKELNKPRVTYYISREYPLSGK